MKAEKVQAINDELRRKTGVDFSRYRNQELTDTVANALTFPLYFVRSLTRPVGLLLAATIIAIGLADSGLFKAFLGFPGLLLAIANGVSLGLVLFVHRIRNDMGQVFSLSAELSMQVFNDIGAAQARLKHGPESFPGLLEIFQGVNAIIILPAVIRVLDRKIPLLGGLAARITERFFSAVDTRLASAIKAQGMSGLKETAPESPQDMSAWLRSARDIIDFTRSILSQVVDKVASIVAFPFAAIFSLVFLISAAILYTGHVLLG